MSCVSTCVEKLSDAVARVTLGHIDAKMYYPMIENTYFALEDEDYVDTQLRKEIGYA